MEMKECPECKEKTIPYQWIFFGKSKYKKGRCFQCTNCGKNIKKSRWLLIDLLLHSDLVLFGLFFLFIIALFQVFQNFVFSLLGAVVLMIAFFMSVAFLSPLREADESYCLGDMTKVGAVLALIAIPTIIIYTAYTLLYKPLVLGEPPFP